MKKVIIVIVLLAFNLCIVYAKMKDKKLNNVNINLKDGELGIVTITLDNSTSLLLKYKDKNILYIIDYLDEKNIQNSLDIFTESIDYTYMLSNYSYKDTSAKVITKQTISDLTLTRNKILYKDKVICINQSTECDFVFITKDDVLINNDVDAIFYSNKLSESYIDYINSFWVDNYRLSNQSYAIITIGDEYEVNNLVK